MATSLVLSERPARRRVQLLHELYLLDESEEERAEREGVEAAVKDAEDAARRVNLEAARAAREVARQERASKRADLEAEYADDSQRYRAWMKANKEKNHRQILPPTFIHHKPGPMSYAEWKLLQTAQEAVSKQFQLSPGREYDSDGDLYEE